MLLSKLRNIFNHTKMILCVHHIITTFLVENNLKNWHVLVLLLPL